MRSVPRALRWLLAVLALAAPAAGAGGGKATGTGIRDIERHLRESFQHSHPCPATGRTTGNCPGYFVGYVLLPKHGGRYEQSNMRWMTEEEAEKSGQDLRW